MEPRTVRQELIDYLDQQMIYALARWYNPARYEKLKVARNKLIRNRGVK